MLKKLILSFCMIGMLVACSGEKTEDESNVQDTKEEEKEKRSEELIQVSKAYTDDMLAVKMFVSVDGVEKEIDLVLFEEEAPKAVENFITHAKDGYYNNVSFHRVIQDFMVQGGDPEGTGRGGESIWGSSFEDEFSSHLINVRGALSMANSGPNTNGSQFFIVQATSSNGFSQSYDNSNANYDNIKDAYQSLGGTPWLDGVHTVFGMVVHGMDVVDEMASLQADQNGTPGKDIHIVRIEVCTYKDIK
ncbi:MULTISPECIES: peptidylprolyl isomerase [unclassified Breznakia]|uniref:peptidylprolyl isomerase n=1 Tax=unclassified Breznakia TaxID=2623764 RepID=UPI0024753DEB|nr:MULTISPECIES: peptidylprolyl isomerase [unclassified Breznakia]MDH6367259.1 peptidyl-prolyl cis-trans isomerase B (cyclophilin B) [Breznakia sp. PH1-1]MDH6404438.1 peptidyl-prolyl cis-trans isomerase B (cyclophilin B) [Breznakia sp. PF1-11]MDH6412171.1 peptidyl-prolyl cis-trans isomerase B (cyclophilin B) [Breznakia sp. PFB1-11]MDH6414426.1 peptidyl-prolyl cis-trans isomerase B (cyclophilin B) [Breznakia sp. PFB1-14]MDH6416811.1 peptidyl-prolyl cis-trans isomerase B (cyclophilin B) [Breznak